MKKVIIGVMGPAKATRQEITWAYRLGLLISEKNWVVLTGGRNLGVMEAASQGAKENGGLTIGILQSSDPQKISKFVDLPIITEMGHARNMLNVLSSDVVIACGKTSAGTLSEIALAVKSGKQVICLNQDPLTKKFLQKNLGSLVSFVKTPEQAIQKIQMTLKR